MAGIVNDGGPTAPAEPSAPDWDRIGFEVRCGRCGQDLRGAREPRCAHCDLEFEWAVVLPTDRLRCPSCQYQVYGLTVPRCPECGKTFVWKQVLEAARAPSQELFEHLWFANPLPALLRTWWLAAFRPTKLWEKYHLNDPPKFVPLIAFMLLQWAVFAVAWFAVELVADPGINQLAGWLGSGSNFNYRFRLGQMFFPLIGFWYVGTFFGFQLFAQSKHRYRIHWKHILRVWIHATAFGSLCMGFSALLEVVVDTSTLFLPGIRGLSSPFYRLLQNAVLLLGLVVTWAHIWIGYHHYLKIPRGWGTGALCLILGLALARIAILYI